jgi:hypothetical protein
MIRSTRTLEVNISTGCNCQSIQSMQGLDDFLCDNLPHSHSDAAVIKKFHFVFQTIFLEGLSPF